MPSMGGPLVTAERCRVHRRGDGRVLPRGGCGEREELRKWHLPAGGQATPMTYRMRTDGKQFVVIAAGGHGSFGVPLGDALVGFALR